MGSLTRTNFIDELRFDLKNRTDSSSSGLSDTRLTRFLNEALLHITRPNVFKHQAMKHRQTLTLVDSQMTYTYTPASDGSTVLDIRFVSYIADTSEGVTSSRQRMLGRSEEWFENRTHTTGSVPRHYCIRDDDTMAISPVPNSDIAGNLLLVAGWRAPTLFVASGTKSELPVGWDEVILIGARWRAQMHLGYREEAELSRLDMVSLINEYRDSEEQNARDDETWSGGVRLEETWV